MSALVMFEDADDDDGYILGLTREEIDACEDHETLLDWYLDAVDLADDLIAQIETNKLTASRDDEWERRVGGALIGTKKKVKAIERRASAVGCVLPLPRKRASDLEIEKAQKRAYEARTFERGCVVEWLEDKYGDTVAHVIAAINDLEHHKHRRTKTDDAEYDT